MAGSEGRIGETFGVRTNAKIEKYDGESLTAVYKTATAGAEMTYVPKAGAIMAADNKNKKELKEA